MRNFYKSIGLAVTLVMVVFIVNFFTVFYPAYQRLAEDTRNKGIKVWVYHHWMVKPSELVFDLREVSGQNSMMDVNRTLLQIAEQFEDRDYNRIILAFKGEPKFMLQGRYFKNLGQEYGYQNAIYTIRTMPENVQRLDGLPAFGKWSGGIFAVMGQQMQDLQSFHEQWYLKNDL